jgi:hypothetical protein
MAQFGIKIGCGCCQTRNGPTGDGDSAPLGLVIFGQRAPAQPCFRAVASARGKIFWW